MPIHGYAVVEDRTGGADAGASARWRRFGRVGGITLACLGVLLLGGCLWPWPLPLGDRLVLGPFCRTAVVISDAEFTRTAPSGGTIHTAMGYARVVKTDQTWGELRRSSQRVRDWFCFTIVEPQRAR